MLQPGSRVGPYVVESFVAAGGMGIVYRARHAPSGRLVALKVLLESLALDEQVRVRFAQGAWLQGQLDHPNIIRVEPDFVVDPATVAFAMEFVDGPTLATAIANRPGPWRIADVLAVLLPVVDAVAYAHGRRVLHRDLKPGNILLDGATPKIADFDLAKISDAATSAARTRAGSLLGTPPYMSPEQFRGDLALGPTTDVFALGMIAWELLAGELPVVSEDMLAVAEVYSGRRSIPPFRTLGGVPASLARVLDRALELRPDSRHEDAAALRTAIRRALVEGADENTDAGVRLPPARSSVVHAESPPPSSVPPSNGPAPGAGSDRASGLGSRMVIGIVLGAGLTVLAGLGLFGAGVVLAFSRSESGGVPVPALPAPMEAAVAPAAGPALDRIRQRGELLVAMDTGEPAWAGTPPMYLRTEAGGDDGFDYQLAVAIARELGAAKVKIVHAKYSELPAALKEKQADLIISGYSPAPEAGIAWSAPYLEYGLCLVVPAGSSVHDVGDLWGKPVGIFDDDAAAEEVEHMVKGYTRLVRLEDGYWDELLAGRFAGFIYDYPYAAAEIEEYYAENPKKRGRFRIAQYNLSDSTYAVGVRSGEPELLSVVNGAIAHWRAGDDYVAAIKHFLGGGAPVALDVGPGGNVYVVAAGDTLTAIARVKLGDSGRWTEIWELNKARFPNPNLIEIGAQVVLP